MPASVFTQENFARLDLVIAQHKGEQGALMPVLYEAKKIFGFISIDIQERISKGLDIPLSEIYGVASFYSTFSDKQKGENIIAVCLGTACYVKGSQKIIDKISKKLNIEVGDTTSDGKFSLVPARCVGACSLAPVVTINADVYGKAKLDDIDSILSNY
ncbi:NADH-quinone oxidoreductase subunit E [Acetoanaerobium noterae]|jgi:NADH-quinone oxidoreductase subunit E|uniref:HymA protein n=2 Tax=Acetoanaerobium TaxID=186831 RepID=E3PSC9_ACESD|nr:MULTISPECIES: NAD(P)H-dependent oxidoreductase subunit E [Acetoanaerobium]MBP8763422.1 NAD(P)H-dependent oxidoreductase subunit E [Acetoanaerobium sp.]MBP9499719.1 NAD(P)H-dependent oxidoreductase subunit E [Acetoanaerobium sp.]MBP9562597.1 NAD(P)H-dependent oxidoreductase subunit E [Acetoanaerobium sp.]CBH21783.1 HymA protein [Acetoanaerobium sticklandii]SKB26166.1 NADH-quinone oxidoreductase subunit E [Acetoanaerobium noterae]